MVLSFPVRVRDLVHGFVHITELEEKVVNHRLFQRLRHVRQNDLGHYVYPSLNTSRFEHSLGCAAVAGKMAANLPRSTEWPVYQTAAGLQVDTFVQIARLYALLHDVGHLPMSHLFETAFEDYVEALFPDESVSSISARWFGGKGFGKPHEAWGGMVAERILDDIGAPDGVKVPVLHLISTKRLPRNDILRPVKLLVDSEIDADRVDATARDGFAAGGEYGNYDIERICSAVFLQQRQGVWRLAYSHKAISSIEALLLDRYRSYTHIHFHHRVVALRVAAAELISRLLIEKIITEKDFSLTNLEEAALRDDLWLWAELRKYNAASTASLAARRAILYRDKASMRLLWKNRTEYRKWDDRLRDMAGIHDIPRTRLGREYEQHITGKLGIETRAFLLTFEPISNERVPLTSENGSADIGELRAHSRLVASLDDVWSGEPQWYVVLLGAPQGELDSLREVWVEHTAAWLTGGGT